MGKTMPTVWDLDPHTGAKHEILRRYLDRWLPILGKWNGHLNYVDGFAGPGVYSGGEPGSPVIAVTRMANHPFRPEARLSFYFIEEDPKRAAMLEEQLDKIQPGLPMNWTVDVEQGKFAEKFEAAIDAIEGAGQELAPTFVLLDPFGVKGMPMRLIQRILKHQRCEVLVNFMASFTGRFVGQFSPDIMNDLFGDDSWKKAEEIDGLDDRVSFLVRLYEEKLQENGAKYVRSFEVRDKRDRVLYYLIYATRHLKGLEAMKEAMWPVDPSGSYTFSDMHAGPQRRITDYVSADDWAVDAGAMLHAKFGGETVPVEEIGRYVVAETPFIFRKKILKQMEDNGKIAAVAPRKRKGTFPDGCRITFV